MTVPNASKVGLVLSGGGAKGAYQVGVLKALLELETQVDMVAGASIGALNGAVLASAPTLQVGVERLERLWLTLAESSPVSLNMPSYLGLLGAVGLRLNGVNYLESLLQAANKDSRKMSLNFPFISTLQKTLSNDSGLLCDKRVQALIDEYLDSAQIARGMPLFVSAFKSAGGMNDLLRILLAESGLAETADSEFIHLQSLPATEQKEALLASASLPMLYAPREIDGAHYSDGGQGGWQRMQGNTPITPLLHAGCNMVLVTHLSDGSLWSRHDFPEATVLEIRPQQSIARDAGIFGGAKDLLGFNSTKIPSWIDQGYTDTMHCVGGVRKANQARNALHFSEAAVTDSERRGQVADRTLESVLMRLRDVGN